METIKETKPSIYVGTYRKYNEGSIAGKWMDLTEFNDYEAFLSACKALHADEEDPEYMIQDFEGFPKALYSESGLPSEEDFDFIRTLAKSDKQEAFEAYLSYYGEVKDYSDAWERFEEVYQGEYDSERSFADQLADETIEGLAEGESTLAKYFDYEAFARDLFLGDYNFIDGHVFICQ